MTFIDLFAGAGGFSLGFMNAGLKCLGALEYDVSAAQKPELYKIGDFERLKDDHYETFAGYNFQVDMFTDILVCTGKKDELLYREKYKGHLKKCYNCNAYNVVVRKNCHRCNCKI